MQDELWNVFSDTGDPVCYLIYRAGKRAQYGKTIDDDSKAERGMLHSFSPGKTAGPSMGEKSGSLLQAPGANFTARQSAKRLHMSDSADERRPFG